MTALTKDTNIFTLNDHNYARRTGNAGAHKYFAGQLLMLGLDDGIVKPLSASKDGVDAIGVGRATRNQDLSAGVVTGSYYTEFVDYEEGTITNINVYSSDAVTFADINNVVFGYDDNTIAKTSGSDQRPKFGILAAMNADGTAQVVCKRGLISSGSTR